MDRAPSYLWRLLFAVGGLLFFAGSFHHPRGVSMAEMLMHPQWIPSHAAVFVGLVLMTLGLMAFRRSTVVSDTMQRWLSFTVLFAWLEVVEMAVHTLAFVDAGALSPEELMGGLATPVLTVHLVLATLVYTPFAVALIGLIWTGQRERSLGSPWIAWLGLIGAVSHGSVMWLAIVLGIPGTGLLFPIYAMTLSLWFVLAGLWPTRQHAETAPAAAAGQRTALAADAG